MGQRAVAVAAERGQGQIIIVANKVADAEDDARIRSAFDQRDLATVPVDPVVTTADRQGMSPIDVDPNAPAVTAIGDIATLVSSLDESQR